MSILEVTCAKCEVTARAGHNANFVLVTCGRCNFDSQCQVEPKADRAAFVREIDATSSPEAALELLLRAERGRAARMSARQDGVGIGDEESKKATVADVSAVRPVPVEEAHSALYRKVTRRPAVVEPSGAAGERVSVFECAPVVSPGLGRPRLERVGQTLTALIEPDIFAAAIAALHGGHTDDRETWRIAKVGDRVRVRDGWAACDLGYRGGVATVHRINGDPAYYGNEYRDPECRLGLQMDRVTMNWAWAKNTHILGIVEQGD